MTNTINTTINGKKVLGVAGSIAFLENGSFHYMTDEVINNEDFCGSDFTLPQIQVQETFEMTDEQKKSNYRGKNFDPNYKDRFKNKANNTENKSGVMIA